MNPQKWLVVIPPYLAVWAGLFLFKSAFGALLGFHAAMLLVLLWLRPPLPIGVLFKPARWRHVLLNMLLCGLSGLGIYLMWGLFGITPDLRQQLDALGLHAAGWAGFIAYFTLVNPLFEEYFWRGTLGSPARGLYVGDLFYASYHIVVVWGKVHPLAILLTVAVLLFIGWLWRQLYRRDGSLLAPVLGHMTADFSILLAVFLKTSGQV